MRKKKIIKKHSIKNDKKYYSQTVSRLINKIMKKGEKRIATKIVYQAASVIEKQTSLSFLEVLEGSLKNIKPSLETRKRKFGSSNQHVPVKVEEPRALTLSLRWLVESAREKKTTKPMFEKLVEEIINGYNKTGGAFKKKEDIQKTAILNMSLFVSK